MTHIRQSIRTQLTTQLTGLTTTGSNVFDTRVYLLDESELPALSIWAQSETIEVDNLTAPRDVQRETDFIVTATAKGNTGYQNTLDAICAEVEAALSTDLSVNGLAKDILLTDLLFEFEEGDQPIGKMEMTYTVTYRTQENNAEVAT